MYFLALTNFSEFPLLAWAKISLIQSGVCPREPGCCWLGLTFELFFGVVTPGWRANVPARSPFVCGLLPFECNVTPARCPFTGTPSRPLNRGEASGGATRFGEDATNLGFAPPKTFKSPSGELTRPGDNIGTETFGFRGWSCGGWPRDGGIGGGWTPRMLPGGSGGPIELLPPDMEILEPEKIRRLCFVHNSEFKISNLINLEVLRP